MNWLDYLILAVLGFAMVRGFFRGFVVEVCALLGVVIGIWAAVRFNAVVAKWIGTEHEALSFLVVFLAVLVLVHLLARAVTKALDLAQLSLPNQIGGIVFGGVRSAFVLSVLLNVLMARAQFSSVVPKDVLEGSTLYAPLRGFAPLVVPALAESKWVKRALSEWEEMTQ